MIIDIIYFLTLNPSFSKGHIEFAIFFWSPAACALMSGKHEKGGRGGPPDKLFGAGLQNKGT